MPLVTMRTIFITLRSGWRRRRPAPPMLARARKPAMISRARLAARVRPASQSGFTIVEVIVSALMVGLIVTATFTGFDAAARSSASERAHAQATQLAQQDEDRLRGLTTATLGQLGTVETLRADGGACVEKLSSTYYYYNKTNTAFCEKTELAGKAYGGTVFTVKSSASYVAASKETLTCETSGGTADYLRTSSSVTWPSLGSHPPVTQSSIVTNPATTALLVTVQNQNNEPVEGATVTVTGASTNAVQTTPAAGCVIFGGIADKSVEVGVSKASWVDHQGKSPPPKKTMTLSAVSLTEAKFTVGEPGSIVAEFESNGSTIGVTGDTFYALQNEIASPPDFVGGTAGTYGSSAAVAGLFPFVTPGKPATKNPYTAFAGDCEANSPAKVTEKTEKLSGRAAQVEPGGSTTVKLEVPKVNMTVWEGETEAKKEKELENSESAKVINKECSAASAQNLEKVPYEHKVTISKGKLEPAYWPYAKELELCVVGKLGANYYKSKTTFANSAKAGTAALKMYLKGAGYTKSASKLEC